MFNISLVGLIQIVYINVLASAHRTTKQMKLVGKEEDLLIFKDKEGNEDKLRCSEDCKKEVISSVGKLITVKILNGTIIKIEK